MPIRLKHLQFYTFDELPQGSAEWQLFRNGKITASNAGLLLRKGRNAAILENKRPVFNNQYTDRGHALEAEVRERVNRLIGKDGYVIKEFGSITNDNYPNCAYSPDGVMFPTSMEKLTWEDWAQIPLVEIKSYNDKTISKDGSVKTPNKHLKCVEDISNVPFEAIVQMQFGMMIAEKQVCYLILYNSDCEQKDKQMKVWTINRDENIIKRLKEKIGVNSEQK